MTKIYPRMKCAVCNRPLLRAAALLKGQPVGRVCAESTGLVAHRRAALAGRQTPGPNAGGAAIVRDTLTLDLFTS